MHTNYDVLGMADLSADYTKMHDTTVLSITKREMGKYRALAELGNFHGK